MRIIITERQYSLLNEQSDFMMDRRGNALANAVGIRSDADYKKVNDILTQSQKLMFKDVDPHLVLAIVGIGSAFIPVAGPFISAGIGLLDAGLYYKEGDKTSAGISAFFSILPFVGKIPGVKDATSAAWKSITSKLSSGGKLAPAEVELVKQVATNAPSVQTVLTTASRKLSPLVNEIAQLKPVYISRYGQDAYEKLMREFISGAADKNYFLQTLKAGGQAAPKTVAVAKFGLKFSQSELSSVKNLASEVLYGGDVLNHIDVVTSKGMKKIKVIIADDDFIKKFFPGQVGSEAFTRGDDTIVLVKNSLNKFDKTNIEELLYHEIAHIKDPAQVSSKLASSYIKPGQEATFKNYFGHTFEKTANLTSTVGNMTNTFNYWKKLMPQEQLTGYLDEIINYGKGKIKSLSSSASAMIGKDGVQQLSDLYRGGDMKAFNNFISKIVQQADYLKSQVKITM